MTRPEINAAIRLLDDYLLALDVKACRGELTLDDLDALKSFIQRIERLASLAEILDDDLRGGVRWRILKKCKRAILCG